MGKKDKGGAAKEEAAGPAASCAGLPCFRHALSTASNADFYFYFLFFIFQSRASLIFVVLLLTNNRVLQNNSDRSKSCGRMRLLIIFYEHVFVAVLQFSAKP